MDWIKFNKFDVFKSNLKNSVRFNLMAIHIITLNSKTVWGYFISLLIETKNASFHLMDFSLEIIFKFKHCKISFWIESDLNLQNHVFAWVKDYG